MFSFIIERPKLKFNIRPCVVRKKLMTRHFAISENNWDELDDKVTNDWSLQYRLKAGNGFRKNQVTLQSFDEMCRNRTSKKLFNAFYISI